MRIRWYGMSAFRVTDGSSVFIDPFPANAREILAEHGITFDFPPIEAEADVLLITHEHVDHNGADAVKGASTVVRSAAGTFESSIGTITGIASEHDDVAGTRRGQNVIFTFSLDDVSFCHLGDLGHPLRPEQKAAIGDVDVLFLPAGGGPTLGAADAAATARELAPRVVVPMHFRTPHVNFLEPPDAVLAALDAAVDRRSSSDVELALPPRGDDPVVLLLAPPISSLRP